MWASRFVTRLVVGATYRVVAVGLVDYGNGQFVRKVVERAIGNAGDGAKPVVGSPSFQPTDWAIAASDLSVEFDSFDCSDEPALGSFR